MQTVTTRQQRMIATSFTLCRSTLSLALAICKSARFWVWLMSSSEGCSTPVVRSHCAYLSRFCGVIVALSFNLHLRGCDRHGRPAGLADYEPSSTHSTVRERFQPVNHAPHISITFVPSCVTSKGDENSLVTPLTAHFRSDAHSKEDSTGDSRYADGSVWLRTPVASHSFSGRLDKRERLWSYDSSAQLAPKWRGPDLETFPTTHWDRQDDRESLTVPS